MKTQVSLGNMPTWASNIVEQIRIQGYPQELERQRQVICLAEEVGELLGAWRRYEGWARRSGSLTEVQAEMADVIIAGYVTAYVLEIDLTTAISDKLDVIFTRGWHDET